MGCTPRARNVVVQSTPIKGEEYLGRILDEGHEVTEKKEDGTVVRKLVSVHSSEEQAELDPVCPKCAGDVNWIEQYGRWYCYHCEEYIGEEKKQEHTCPTCNGELTFVEQYQRWYCYSCQQYMPQ